MVMAYIIRGWYVEPIPDVSRLTFSGTVLSIQENPYPDPTALSERELDALTAASRRNIQLIFRGVSRQHSATSENDSLVTIRVRPIHDPDTSTASIKQEDGPSLLFYYIFDDWVSSYSLVAKREHGYSVDLDRLVLTTSSHKRNEC
jgi:hypothetical protein